MDEYRVVPEIVMAGEEFELSFMLKNTSEKVNVQNLKISVKPEGADIIPAEKSNTLYLKSLGRGKSHEFSYRLRVRQDAQPKAQKLMINMEYEDSKAAEITAVEEILVQVKQPIRIEFDSPNIPSSVNAGDTLPISLNVFNMGRSILSNVMCKIEAPGLIPEGSSFLGNMEPGAAKTMSLSEQGGIPAEAAENEENYGKTSGVIHVTYEDEF